MYGCQQKRQMKVGTTHWRRQCETDTEYVEYKRWIGRAKDTV